MKHTTHLRQLLRPGPIVVAPGAHDALTARLIAAQGFPAVYLTGAGVTAAAGIPDIGLFGLEEMVRTARLMSAAIDVPLISDADTGYGNAVNVLRTVREFEAAGAAGIHLEDQVSPKRCGHLAGKQVIPAEEMAGKLRAACAARRDPDFVIIARTDARAVEGFDAAVERGRRYRAAGADLVFPEALESLEEFAEFARRVDAPLLANLTEFGKTPTIDPRALEPLGYRVAIYPASALRVALHAMRAFLTDLPQPGAQAAWLPRMLTRRELYDLIDYPAYEAWGEEYKG
jgi:methylisocitrate lyase